MLSLSILYFYNPKTFIGRICNEEIEKSITHSPYSYDLFHLLPVLFNYVDASKKQVQKEHLDTQKTMEGRGIEHSCLFLLSS